MPKGAIKMDDKELDKISGGKNDGALFMYIVRKRENLAKISLRFSTTIVVLRDLNKIDSDKDVAAGDRILIPVKN